ncbi:MAG: hypothetical protein JXB49_15165 [Bacteroidales bacterium]|nr:hypothetical protein [Bacteroidales bacterium]
MATVAESCDLALNTGTLIQKSSIEDTYLTKNAEILTAKGGQMKISIAADRSKEKTEELAELDSKRDSYLSAIKLLARGYMAWDHDNQKEPASRIYALVEKHGLRMAYENYEEESALVESLVNDLELPVNKEAIATLNMAELVNDLSRTQTAFSTLYRESIVIEAGKEPVKAATELKRELRATLLETVNYLNAMNVARKARYGSLAAQVAEVVNNLNQKIKTRNNNK